MISRLGCPCSFKPQPQLLERLPQHLLDPAGVFLLVDLGVADQPVRVLGDDLASITIVEFETVVPDRQNHRPVDTLPIHPP